jgi:hypothetical protein
MEGRKKKIIDKKFQFRAIFSVAVIALVSFSMITALITFFSVRSRTNIETERIRLENSIKIEDNIVTAFIEYAIKSPGGAIKLSTKTVEKDHTESMDAIKNHIAMLQRYTDDYFYLLLSTIGITILVIAVYCLYMLHFTHRISGPIFVMSRHIQEMLDGREPQFRDLRDKDEFKELYARVVELGGKMKEKKK